MELALARGHWIRGNSVADWRLLWCADSAPTTVDKHGPPGGQAIIIIAALSELPDLFELPKPVLSKSRSQPPKLSRQTMLHASRH